MAITFPEQFNLATYYLDSRIDEGFGDKIAVYCGDRRYTYREVQQMSNEWATRCCGSVSRSKTAC